MIENSHKGLEAMSALCNALKGEQWSEAERKLLELQNITTGLLRTVGDKIHEQLMAPTRQGDRE
jgi:hypothetical protein